MRKPAVAIIGMGGFARSHHEAVRAMEAEGECRLLCTCDPGMAQMQQRQQELQFDQRGVHCYVDYLTMLDAHRAELDMVTIPTPIPMHAPMHEACVSRGLAVYLEKPPTLDDAELTGMLAVEERARHSTQVGFNFIMEAPRQQYKRRIVNGEFGEVRRIGVAGLWPRSTTYYQRAPWAGRLMLHGQLVLDSCLGNAMAHYVHNGLFWGGIDELWQWGDPREVKAELYRAHDIEGADTVFVNAVLQQGPEVRIGMTHACVDIYEEYEWVECADAMLHHRWESTTEGQRVKTYSVIWADGRKEFAVCEIANHLQENLRLYLQYLRGDCPRPLTRLIDSRPFVQLNDLAYLAAGSITQVAEESISRRAGGAEQAGVVVAVDDIIDTVKQFMHTGDFPSAQGRRWALPGGTATPDDLPRLHAVIAEMVANRTISKSV